MRWSNAFSLILIFCRGIYISLSVATTSRLSLRRAEVWSQEERPLPSLSSLSLILSPLLPPHLRARAKLLGHARRDDLVVVELHRVTGAALRQRAKVRRITEGL